MNAPGRRCVAFRAWSPSSKLSGIALRTTLVSRAMLAALGGRGAIAKDGLRYLAAPEQRPIDCVLRDGRMSGMDRYTADRTWRLREAGSERPRQRIAALSSNAADGDRAQCIAAGMDDFLPKPFKRDHLRALIAAHLPLHGDADGIAAEGTNAADPLAAPSSTNTLDGSSHRNHHAEF